MVWVLVWFLSWVLVWILACFGIGFGKGFSMGFSMSFGMGFGMDFSLSFGMGFFMGFDIGFGMGLVWVLVWVFFLCYLCTSKRTVELQIIWVNMSFSVMIPQCFVTCIRIGNFKVIVWDSGGNNDVKEGVKKNICRRKKLFGTINRKLKWRIVKNILRKKFCFHLKVTARFVERNFPK